jgi:hypothetical protein
MKRFTRVLCSAILVVAACATLSPRVEAQSSQSGNLNFTAYKVAIVVGAVAVGAIVAVVLIHKSSGSETAITGCVSSEDNGLTLTNDRDNRLYVLTGNTSGITPGDRMSLKVKQVRSKKPGNGFAWETKKITKGLGACQH